jgi:hypothetical protein
MKKLLVAFVATLVAVSVAGCVTPAREILLTTRHLLTALSESPLSHIGPRDQKCPFPGSYAARLCRTWSTT